MASSTVKVVVRCKPKEDPTSDHLTAVDLPQSPGNSTIILHKGANPTEGLYHFNFTRVLDERDQPDVYNVCAKSMVPTVLDGINCTIMAYGQTGSGKTFTMTGPEGRMKDPNLKGIVPRLVEDIFSDVERRGLKAVITCSYIEIYNETFRDLLGSEDSDIGISEVGRRMILKGAAQPKVGCSREALELLLQGEKTRHVAGHGMNSRSSRSHTIFTMLISTVTSTGQKLCSKLNLVDLAGSERANKTGVSGAAAREALYINKSLTFLEQVIVALAKKNPGHIPYRSSKLTWFLKDSLGGNCKTVLIANMWNSYHQINETISTCRFAHRMMSVAENAHANHDGFNSVHGNLFKLDPVMQGYLEQVTAAAVAREKAKLLREFEKYGHPWGEATNGLAADERGELEGLRKKVSELEDMQEMTKAASEAARNGVVVDRETLDEMEMLRKRLLELEAENVVKSLDQPAAPVVAELEEEVQMLRQRVVEMEVERQQSEQLRAQVREMQERELQRQAAESSATGKKQFSDGEFRELLWVKAQQSGGGGHSKAPSMDSRVEHSVGGGEGTEEVSALRDRVRQLEAAHALGNLPSMLQTAAPLTARTGVMTGSSGGSGGGVVSYPPSEVGDSASEAGWGHQDGEGKVKKKNTLGKLRKGLAKVLKGGGKGAKGRSGSVDLTRGASMTPTPRFPPETTAAQAPEEAGGAPNIVILNSLTHEQLMELLKGGGVPSVEEEVVGEGPVKAMMPSYATPNRGGYQDVTVHAQR